jgi:RNA polymerase subunit RPABC4/transcription elongation factor Spt4
MPTFKHPCPHCGKFIERDVKACPYCATPDPFAPARCPSCSAVIEDRSWAACPKCGQALVPATAPRTVPSANQPPPEAFLDPAIPPPTPSGPSMPAGQPQPGAATCAGCGSPLTAGARFCTVCGTLAS